ncbi:hypothetical protein FM042_08835 [Aliidiomarina halalkaliphila]|uniref:Uncharacterized protein n=1 Tax=Aliidiomarina halalkaliphila TaxID=2593535 RepID=A0A552WZN2_9GAMM|nr:hypothetical protein [Aliidiomarina halalkaliphila]TRW48281.1 hypothetical protein FM042_08835 [Aliidiomarina halalkaliphila]
MISRIIAILLLVLGGALIWQNHQASFALVVANALPLLAFCSFVFWAPKLAIIWRRTLNLCALFGCLMWFNFQLAIRLDLGQLYSNPEYYGIVAIWAPLYSTIFAAVVGIAVYVVLRIKLARNESI